MKRVSPRWLPIVPFLMLLVTLLGCGQKAGPQTRTAGDGKRTEIVFWHSYVSYTEPALKRLVARFEKEHPDLKLRPQYVQTGDVMLQKLTTAIATNTLPDCCWVRTNWIPELVHAGAIIDVDELAAQYGGLTPADRADFFPSLMSTASYQGKLRGLPIQATCMTLGANPDLLRSVGLDPAKPPKDWNELVEYAKKLVVRGPKQVDRWGFFIPVFTGQLANYGVWQFDIFLWGWGGQYVAPGGERVAFNSPSGVQALQYWADLQYRYQVGTMTAPEMGFESGKVAMELVGCWDIPHLQTLSFKPVLWPMPTGPARRVFPVDGEYLVVFRKGNHPKEAWEFARWFTLPEIQEQWSAEAKYLPVRRSTLSRPSYQEYLKTDYMVKAFADQMDYATSEPIPFRNGTAIDLLLADAIEKAVRSKADPKQVLDAAAEKANRLLATARAKEAAGGK